MSLPARAASPKKVVKYLVTDGEVIAYAVMPGPLCDVDVVRPVPSPTTLSALTTWERLSRYFVPLNSLHVATQS